MINKAVPVYEQNSRYPKFSLYDYIISLQKNIVSMQTQLKNMAKFVDNLKKRR